MRVVRPASRVFSSNRFFSGGGGGGGKKPPFIPTDTFKGHYVDAPPVQNEALSQAAKTWAEQSGLLDGYSVQPRLTKEHRAELLKQLSISTTPPESIRPGYKKADASIPQVAKGIDQPDDDALTRLTTRSQLRELSRRTAQQADPDQGAQDIYTLQNTYFPRFADQEAARRLEEAGGDGARAIEIMDDSVTKTNPGVDALSEREKSKRHD